MSSICKAPEQAAAINMVRYNKFVLRYAISFSIAVMV